jgi:hypothetical protein
VLYVPDIDNEHEEGEDEVKMQAKRQAKLKMRMKVMMEITSRTENQRRDKNRNGTQPALGDQVSSHGKMFWPVCTFTHLRYSPVNTELEQIYGGFDFGRGAYKGIFHFQTNRRTVW